MKVIEFLKNAPPYVAGETAGFDDDVADGYIRRGTARLLQTTVAKPDKADAPAVNRQPVPGLKNR